jgi:endonuclease/exonuclease/phosphatase family metal-dependent hydrolase
MRVVSWNLKHGRAVPSAGHELFEEFAAALGRWEWDVALLQEVPPWWPRPLGERLGADWRLVLTSRNFGLAPRRAVARRWPDVIKSNGGGSNAVLVRGEGSIVAGRALMLTLRPERRWLLGVRLSSGIWAGTVHLTGGRLRAATREALAAARTMIDWAGGAPVVLGGDFNLRSPALPGFRSAGGFHVDHLFARGFDVAGSLEVLERGHLSDHSPIVVDLTPAARPGS